MKTLAEDFLRTAPALVDAGLRWRHRFATLGPDFYARLAPEPLPHPYWVARSDRLAAELGLDAHWMASGDALAVFAGNAPLAGSSPLASVYGGHQFGNWAGQLGDGRAILLGELLTPSGAGMELQLKGSGLTPFSRMGDGRAVLRSSIREFLASEAMHALGVPTTRALCIVGSNAPVLRETVETAAVVTRAAPSFLRFGHFEYFAWRGKTEELRALLDYAVTHFFPACERQDVADTACALLAAVTERTAELLAHWQAVGFCHGVMNTDNMSILGLTIDYGPFGFVDAFDANHVCNHSDEHGRYAYAQQPMVAHWNLYCLGQALLPLTEDVEATQAALETFKDEFARAISAQFNAKLGLTTTQDGDTALTERLLALLDAQRVDWTLFWRRLAQLPLRPSGPRDDAPVRDLFADRAAFDAWAVDYRARLAAEHSVDVERAARMNRVNPKYVLRNYLAETAIRKACGTEGGRGARDFSEIARLLACLRNPFDEQPAYEDYAALPPEWAGALHLSCSS